MDNRTVPHLQGEYWYIDQHYQLIVLRTGTYQYRYLQCCGAGPTLTRFRLPAQAPAPENNICVTQI